MAMLKILIFNNVKNVILLEERRGDFIMFLMTSQLNDPLQKQISKYTPTTNSYDFAKKKYGH